MILHKKHGFTLIELLVALFISALVLTLSASVLHVLVQIYPRNIALSENKDNATLQNLLSNIKYQKAFYEDGQYAYIWNTETHTVSIVPLPTTTITPVLVDSVPLITQITSTTNGCIITTLFPATDTTASCIEPVVISNRTLCWKFQYTATATTLDITLYDVYNMPYTFSIESSGGE